MVLATELGVAALPVPAMAREKDQLSTCLNLATGVTRVLVRGVCDPVTEMLHVWAATVEQETVRQVFSAKTLAQAVVLNTGGDSRKFTRKDWANIARLQAANEAEANLGAVGQGVEAGAASGGKVAGGSVRAVVATCVNDATGASRVVASGGCDGQTESRRLWMSVEPLQKPVVADGAPGVPQVESVRVVDAQSRAVTFTAPDDAGSSPITSMTVIAVPGGQSVTIRSGAGGTALFTGLSPGTRYTFLVVAVNASGAGPRIPSPAPTVDPAPVSPPAPTPTPVPSPSASAGGGSSGSSGGGSGGGGSTSIAAPGSPATPVAVAGDASATVTVAAGTGSGGAPASYLVTAVGTARTCTVTGSSGSCVVTGLSNGTAYTFTATASNSGGTSAASVASASVTPMAVQSITFANPGTRNFGTTPTLTATSDLALTVTLTSSTSGVCTISGGGVLAFVSTGTCSINANQAGNSTTLAAPQVTVSFTVAAVAAGAPTIGAAAMASVTSATVAFTAPISNGGATITSYTATSTPGSVTATLTQSGSGTFTVTGLTTGTTYTFTVTATNAAGTSAASASSGSVTPVVYAVGGTGPGGGLIFLISGGTTYEMAPKAWSGAGTPDATATWCDGLTDVPAATGMDVGTGAANTAAMAASSACSSNAAATVLAYAPSGSSAGEWFLPSRVEMNAMCNYSRNPTAPAAPSVSCAGTVQNSTFAASTYGFPNGTFWTSSQANASAASNPGFQDGVGYNQDKNVALQIRPIRAF
ncbi:MAG: fibronectin type III domain-containing protein [Actinobacteria bacterium]|nr:fibronectin type III domain-containing protein [Actinomycetota bacterium]